MRIFSWMQSKFNGKQEEKRYNAGSSSSSTSSISVSDAGKEEISNWPNALLSIGTLGNKEGKEEQKRDDKSEYLDSSDDIEDITIEEVCKLQKELKELLTLKRKSLEVKDDDRATLPLNKFLNCPSSLEVDRAKTLKTENAENESYSDLSLDSKLILIKVKEMLLGHRNLTKKKSTSFLFKKLFVCSSGFAPAPSLRDPIPESRVEKILRAILAKKIYPQSSTPISVKKYLDNKSCGKKNEAEDKDEKKEQAKWDKTDSECNFIFQKIV